MAHQSLYRKYRPVTFDDVVGQQHIVRTLRNAITADQVAHAYLFSGPRGTGKTTSARLLAKALLCKYAPTENPDGTCDECVEIAEGNHPDVIELDAASRTGVDNVREEIINRVQYSPQRGAYKVYIIDEVHMLSQGAFNAMLKTLEEPPAHVVFILCTTHPHKVPETIRSRCQQFDFRPISTDDIAARLQYIAQAEGISADPAAIALIARHARGAMRDALTALERMVAFSGAELTADDVEGTLGEVDTQALYDLVSAVARRDTATCFRWIASQVQTGADLPEVVRSLVGYVRDIYVTTVLSDADEAIDATEEEIAALRSLGQALTGPERVARMLDVLAGLSGDMRWSTEPRMLLELALVRMTQPQGEHTLEALAERIERLEIAQQFGGGAPVAAPAAAPAPAPAPVPVTPAATLTVPAAAPAPDASVADVAPAAPTAMADPGAVKRAWRSVLNEIKAASRVRYPIYADTRVRMESDGSLVIEYPADEEFKLGLAQDSANTALVTAAIAKVFSREVPYRYAVGTHRASRPELTPEPEPVYAPEPVPVGPDTEVLIADAPPYEPVPEPVYAPEPEPEFGLEPVLQQPPTPAPTASASSPMDDDLLAHLADIGATVVQDPNL